MLSAVFNILSFRKMNSKRAKRGDAFREAYGELGVLRSCVKKVSRFNGYLILAVIIGYWSFPSSKIMGSFVFSGCMFAE